MDNQYCYLKCFEEQIYDAVNLIYLAERYVDFDADNMNFFYYHTLCRSSILAGSLLFESAANCCIDSLGVEKKYITELTKQVDKLSMLSKFEFILNELNPDQKFDRGCLIVQKAQEIKDVRDRYVHPKVRSAEWRALSDNVRTVEWGETPLLKIPFRFHRWKTEHAISVLKAANDFFNLFFLEWCLLDTNTICGLLLQDERVPIPFNASVSVDFMGGLDKAVKDWGVDFRFLGKSV